ncbi:MAG: hypothetical protein MUF83_00540 [Acidimicrobiales bacterium]|jgi:hypothetical protein|nr:hypothetical protein [Acidimicrobiales bacterium]
MVGRNGRWRRLQRDTFIQFTLYPLWLAPFLLMSGLLFAGFLHVVRDPASDAFGVAFFGLVLSINAGVVLCFLRLIRAGVLRSTSGGLRVRSFLTTRTFAWSEVVRVGLRPVSGGLRSTAVLVVWLRDGREVVLEPNPFVGRRPWSDDTVVLPDDLMKASHATGAGDGKR